MGLGMMNNRHTSGVLFGNPERSVAMGCFRAPRVEESHSKGMQDKSQLNHTKRSGAAEGRPTILATMPLPFVLEFTLGFLHKSGIQQDVGWSILVICFLLPVLIRNCYTACR
eukprot:TRINITY_DN26777_c0_g1_i1.p1 TRINITY_DN26777_c0_g1~~TRINITY_DN26777_c0_g1_i1.p1  ORF type:complete len:112 (+),score=12.27 TRINITY_DN26777_c0_g1_i1:174-509(+)